MVKSGSFKVSPGSTLGRIGSGVGKGLAEQLPKEIERGRLAQGLEQFNNESANLSPLQQYTKLLSIPGISPQAVQAIPQVLQQQNFANALSRSAQEAPQRQENLYRSINPESEQQPSRGVTTREGIEASLQPYIPPSRDQIVAEAQSDFPELFRRNPEAAINEVNQREALKEKKSVALQGMRENEKRLQSDISNALDQQRQQSNALIPDDIYKDLRDEAVNSILPKDRGGQGLTDQEANKQYRDKLKEISRQYGDLETVGNFRLPDLSPKQAWKNLNSIRENFKERGDLRNFADTLIGVNKLSPQRAYATAYPISEIPSLHKLMSKIPNVKDKFSHTGIVKSDFNADEILKEMTPHIAKEMGQEGSPLAIYQALEEKGYDPEYFIDYVNKNRKKLNLNDRQAEELGKPRSAIPYLSDLWLFKFLDKDSMVD